MTHPRVSICIPAFNAEKFIRESVDSALGAGTSVEVIVLDDASTDRTVDIARGVADPRVTVVEADANIGRGANVDRALLSGTGEYVVVLPADSTLPSGALDSSLALADDCENPAFVFGAHEVLDEQGVRLRVARPFAEGWARSGSSAVASLLPHDPVLTATALISRAALDRVGGLRLGISPSHRDWDLFLRLATVGQVVYTPGVLARDRRHASNFTDEITGSDRVAMFELQVLTAFDEWARSNAPETRGAVAEGRLRWARSKTADALISLAGARHFTPSTMLGLALAGSRRIVYSPRFAVGLLCTLLPAGIVRRLQPLIRPIARRLTDER